MSISSISRSVASPFRQETSVTVYEDGYIIAQHLADALQIKAERIADHLKDKADAFKRCPRSDTPYRGFNNAPVCNLVSKKGTERFLKEYIRWPSFKVEKAMQQLYPSDVKKSDAAPKKVSFEPEEAKKSVEHALLKQQREFLHKMDQRIGEQAMWRYQQTPEFQERLDALLEKKADAIMPELRKQMEIKMRRELEPVIRQDVKKRIRSEVEAQVEPFRQQMLTQETQKIFSKDVTMPEMDASALVTDILKKRKFTE